MATKVGDAVGATQGVTTTVSQDTRPQAPGIGAAGGGGGVNTTGAGQIFPTGM